MTGAQNHIGKVLSALGLNPAHVEESISRFDYCVDLFTPSFVLVPQDFVFPPRSKLTGNPAEKPCEGFEEYAVSGRYTGVRIGRMPGRQVAVYDKVLDIVQKRKTEWWPIWNANLSRQGLPPLDPKALEGQRIWRCEIRFGKGYLMNRQRRIRSWDDLEQAIGFLLERAITQVRLTIPNADSNQSRWPAHPLWQAVGETLQTQVPQLATEDLVEQVTEEIRKQRLEMIEAQVTGCSASYAALRDLGADDPAEIGQAIADTIRKRAEKDPEGYVAKVIQAEQRYRLEV